MKVLVTGGAGYIGSVMVERLLEDGYPTVVADDLSTGHRRAVPEDVSFHETDLTDRIATLELLRAERPDAVIHMAGAALVGESMSDPEKYFRVNTGGTLNLVEAMIETGSRAILFSSTAAVFGEPEKIPIEETAPKRPTNPYGESKLAVERLLHWSAAAGHLHYGALRYFNAAGATTLNGEAHENETHLIPIALEAAAGEREELAIFGDDWDTRDGTCVRDYIHVSDLADAHIRALSVLDHRNAVYNLGSGDGYTVREVVEAVERVTGKRVPVRIADRRAGDPPSLIASSTRIREELGWTPNYDSLDEIVRSAWEWKKGEAPGTRS